MSLAPNKWKWNLFLQSWLPECSVLVSKYGISKLLACFIVS
jgi:hypothetical protein